MHITSPCVSLCVLDPKTQVCQGCFRTLDEIVSWGTMTNADKEKVLNRIFDDEIECRKTD